MVSESWLRMLALIALLSAPALRAEDEQVPQNVQTTSVAPVAVDSAKLQDFVGHWYAVHTVRSGAAVREQFFDFEFVRDPQGLLFQDHNRFVMVGEPVRVRMTQEGV